MNLRYGCILVLAVLMLGACGGGGDPGLYPGAEAGESQPAFMVLAGQIAEMSTAEGVAEQFFGSAKPTIQLDGAKRGEWELDTGYHTGDSVDEVGAWYESRLPAGWESRCYDNNRGGGYIVGKPGKTVILVSSDSQGQTWILSVKSK